LLAARKRVPLPPTVALSRSPHWPPLPLGKALMTGLSAPPPVAKTMASANFRFASCNRTGKLLDALIGAAAVRNR
jgi:hypothetical protein